MPAKRSKSKTFLAAAASILAILGGLVLAVLPVRLWEQIIAFQLRPTVRPLYPLFFGSIFAAGVAIAMIGLLALLFAVCSKKTQPKESAGALKLIFSINAFLVGGGMMTAICVLMRTAGYIAAEEMYLLLMTGFVMVSLLFGAMGIAGIAGIAAFIKKRPGSRAIWVLCWIPLPLAVMVGITGGLIFSAPDAQRLPYPEDLEFTTLYARGEAGYNTFKIPTMIVAPDGTILAFAEARTDGIEDWSETAIVVRRSMDMGKTWTALEVLFEDGKNVVGNACPVVDQSTGTIHLLFTKNNDTAFKTRSEDNGQTWAAPEEITRGVKLPGWTWYAFGPSHGIQLEDGTLLIPADHVQRRKKYAHVVFSKDGGATWELGGRVLSGDEATLAQLDDGSVYISMRPAKAGYRLTARSYDGGMTFVDVAFDTALPDPQCEGSLIKVPRPGQESAYLYINPADKLHREKMTIRLSEDGCRTWTYSKCLYEGLASYSALTLIDAETGLIGAYFEVGANFYAEEIVFTSFPVGYVME